MFEESGEYLEFWILGATLLAHPNADIIVRRRELPSEHSKGLSKGLHLALNFP